MHPRATPISATTERKSSFCLTRSSNTTESSPDRRNGSSFRATKISSKNKAFVNNANALKKATLIKGGSSLINLYMTGDNRRTALKLLFNLMLMDKLVINPEPIEYWEVLWLENTTNGALMWADKYKGPSYAYDYISFYPSLMKSEQFFVPIKQGKLMTLTKEQFESMENITYGIYRCKIKVPDRLMERIFKPNRKNYYTSYDLMFAKMLNLPIELIQENKPNFNSFYNLL